MPLAPCAAATRLVAPTTRQIQIPPQIRTVITARHRQNRIPSWLNALSLVQLVRPDRDDRRLMTTGVPESDSYPDSGGRGGDVRPGVPGWNAGQDYTGPLFDDTGWHIDLSDVDWGDSAGHDGAARDGAARDGAARDRADEWAADGNHPFRFEDQGDQYGNGAGPATASYDRAPQAPPGWTERRSGRHARRA